MFEIEQYFKNKKTKITVHIFKKQLTLCTPIKSTTRDLTFKGNHKSCLTSRMPYLNTIESSCRAMEGDSITRDIERI